APSAPVVLSTGHCWRNVMVAYPHIDVPAGNWESAPLPLRVQKLGQVGLVGGKPLPGRLGLPHAVPASGEQRRTSLSESHVGAALVPRKPAFGERTVKTGPVLARTTTGLEERRVDQLNVDAAVLHRLDGTGDLDQLAGGGIRIGEGTGLDELHAASG